MKSRYFLLNKWLSSVVLSFCMIGTTFAQSNDPLGKYYLKQAVGDLSNCGPISALMARQYSQSDFRVVHLLTSIREARGKSHHHVTNDDDIISSMSSGGNWWKMSDIKSYFQKNRVTYQSKRVSNNPADIVRALKKNQIVIINLNMNDIPRGTRRIGKPYFTFPIPGGWGHYLVIIGFDYIDGELVFEAHDSFRQSGKNRQFYAKHIMRAVKRYYPEVLLIHKN